MDAPPPEWDASGPPPGPPPTRESPAAGHRDWGAAPPPDWVRTSRGNDRGWSRDGRRRRGEGRDRFRGPEQPPEPIDPRQALAKREQSERAFLSYCLALPELGEARLATVDIDDYFSSVGTREAAAYLRGRLRSPMSDIAPENEALARLVAELVVKSGRLDATKPKFELEDLQLELHRLERHISNARITGAGVRDLAVERQRVLDEIRRRLL
jgi:DNA primase